MRNQFKVADVVNCVYIENDYCGKMYFTDGSAKLRSMSHPFTNSLRWIFSYPVVRLQTQAILFAVGELLDCRIPEVTGKTRLRSVTIIRVEV